MWKVIAADDEGYIREALQKLINWEGTIGEDPGRNAGHCDNRYTDAWC